MRTHTEDLCSAAAEIYIESFPLLLADIIRRAHPIAAHQLQIVPDCSALAPGIAMEEPHTIVASAWIDVTEQPVVLRIPDSDGRDRSFTFIDATGEIFASHGARPGHESEHHLALVGPDWRGALPSGLTAKRSPTNRLWALSRCFAHSALDRKAALALVRRQQLVDLKPGRERAPMATLDAPATPPLNQTVTLSPAVFFQRLSTIMRAEPHCAAFVPSLAILRERLGGPPPASQWTPEFAAELERGLQRGVTMLETAAELYPVDPLAGFSPRQLQHAPQLGGAARAVRAMRSLGADAPENQLILKREHDRAGRRLNGGQAYRLHFSGDSLPPVRGFWRLSPRPAASPHFRPSVSDRSQLQLNPDGSLDIHVQAKPPASEHLMNWLPTPAGEYVLELALHRPSVSALNGGWRFPAPDLIETPAVAPARKRRALTPPLPLRTTPT